MATSSTSNKKIQRVQRAGVSRRAGQRRPLGFPAAVIGIIVVGLILVWFARDARINVDGQRPRAGIDTWFQAYGTYSCDEYLENVPRPVEPADIESLGNGVILVGPNSEATAGENARFSHFFDAQGIEIADDSVTFADGTTISAGDSCGEGDDATTATVLKMFVWPPQATNRTEPRIVESNFGDVRFEQGGQAFALALVPADTDTIDLPGSIDRLSNPTEGQPARPTVEGEVPTTSTTIATDTTVPGDLAPGDSAPEDSTEAPSDGDTTTTTGG